MKFPIYLLSALLLISCASGVFVQVPQQEIISSPLINELLQYGLNYNFQKAGQKYGISTNNIAVTKINSVYREVLNGRTNYKFDVEATNNNDATMNATFTIQYTPRTGQKIVSQWQYHINYNTNPNNQNGDASYVPLSEEEVLNNPVIVNLLKYGVAYSFEKASEKYGVSNNNIVVTQINSVEQQQLKNKVNYRFDVVAHNDDVTKMNTKFTIEYWPNTGNKIVRKWWYHIFYRATPEEVEDQNENEDEINNEECIIQEEEMNFFEIAEEGVVNILATENVETSLVNDVEIELSVETETTVDNSGDYQQLSAQEIQNSPLINQLLDFGLQYCFDKAAQKYGISNDDVEVTAINSVYKQQLNNNQANYQFNVAATNNDDATMNANFTIGYNSQNQNKVVREWSYFINYQNGNNN